ncbi:hypothetical protein KA005_60800 [bacterium]|nr:hypothetical protein [bacterium]
MATGFQWTELFLKHQKELAALAILLTGTAGVSGYFVRDVFPETKVVIAEETVPEVIKPLCDENTVARICGKVILKHQDSLWH